MGGSILCCDNKMNMKTKSQTILINGCSDDTHDSSKYQNICNRSINEEKSEIISSKFLNTQVIENNNIVKQRVFIPEPEIELKEGIDYEIFKIKETDKENELLNKLFEMFKKEESANNNVIVKYKNGEKYIGEWDAKHLREGRGIHIFSNNNIYFGNWENNKMNGIGKMIKFSEKINDLNEIFDPKVLPFYCGNWKNNLENGEGEEIWKDNSIYKGEYKDGFKHGKGILILPDGTEYEGEYSQGQIEGKGKMKYKDGRVYEGNWLNNKMNGEGIFSWPDGRCYKGNYLNNYKDGFGEFIWPDGKIYKGMWAKGLQNGKGQLYNKDYDIWITGIWKDGIRIKKKND